YTSCCNTDKGIYYYKTYENSQISAVNINNENLDTNELIIYNLVAEQQINYQN
ncbi:MAG: linear amide C-N hydrolase, partial [Clostridia bacterium]|nr:linear amide C-N hydrolase [Clostridia bacterium]